MRPLRIGHIHPSPLIAKFGLCLIATLGCSHAGEQKPTATAPMVTVAPATERSVVQYEYATGRVESPSDVQIRARVSGYLIKIQFKPGIEVSAGTPLFEIDPEPFKADLAKAEGDLARAKAEVPMSEAAVSRSEAQLVRATADFRRSEKMLATNAISREEYDKSRADMLEADAMVRGSKAKVESDKAKVESEKARVHAEQLNLNFCSIRAPIAGKIGDTLVTEGNLISGGAGSPTVLTSIVSVDPMFVAFDLDENTLQRLQKAERELRTELRGAAGEIPADMGLSVHGTDYPIKGAIKFVNNQVDSKTGTIRVKAEFANPKPASGARLLSTGMFARIRVPIGKERKAMLIPDSAILTDQGKSYALIVDAEKKAVRVDLTTGAVVDGYRVIEAVQSAADAKPRPVRSDEQFIVSGLQRVRPGMTIDPKPVAAK